jgi:hypothetical protein
MNFGDQIGYTRPNKDPSMPIAFNDPSFRMPQKRGGGFGNLGEAIRRMQEQGGMGMPRIDPEWKVCSRRFSWIVRSRREDLIQARQNKGLILVWNRCL